MLCCNMRHDIQAHQNFILGNAFNETLANIFMGNKIIEYRKLLACNGKKFTLAILVALQPPQKNESNRSSIKQLIAYLKFLYLIFLRNTNFDKPSHTKSQSLRLAFPDGCGGWI